jgi:hypothetical protein
MQGSKTRSTRKRIRYEGILIPGIAPSDVTLHATESSKKNAGNIKSYHSKTFKHIDAIQALI